MLRIISFRNKNDTFLLRTSFSIKMLIIFDICINLKISDDIIECFNLYDDEL